MEEFIKNFANQFDDTDILVFNAKTNFRDLEEWSSLTELAVLNMIEKKYKITLKAEEMKGTNSIQELFDLIQSKL